MSTCVSCYVVLIFFFFKQKTAYEMRISDWSSDVCSSDLHGRQPCSRHGTGHAHFALASDLGTRNRGVLLVQEAYRRCGQKKIDTAVFGLLCNKGLVIAQHSRQQPGRDRTSVV